MLLVYFRHPLRLCRQMNEKRETFRPLFITLPRKVVKIKQTLHTVFYRLCIIPSSVIHKIYLYIRGVDCNLCISVFKRIISLSLTFFVNDNNTVHLLIVAPNPVTEHNVRHVYRNFVANLFSVQKLFVQNSQMWRDSTMFQLMKGKFFDLCMVHPVKFRTLAAVFHNVGI